MPSRKKEVFGQPNKGQGIMEKKMETTIVYWGYIGIMEKKMETTIVYWGYIGIMEKKMETTIVYWGYIGIMEKKMETTILGYIGFFFSVRECWDPDAPRCCQHACSEAHACRLSNDHGKPAAVWINEDDGGR